MVDADALNSVRRARQRGLAEAEELEEAGETAIERGLIRDARPGEQADHQAHADVDRVPGMVVFTPAVIDVLLGERRLSERRSLPRGTRASRRRMGKLH